MRDRVGAGSILALLWTLAAGSAHGASLTLAWDPSPDAQVTGYIVYVGTRSGVYDRSLDVGNVISAQLADAVDGTRYYLAVASYAGSMVGPPSNEVSAVAGSTSGSGGSTPPSYSLNSQSSGTSAYSLTVAWDPSQDSRVTGYIVYVGTQSGVYYTNIDVGNVLSAQFSEVQSGVRYYFAVAAYADGVVGAASAEVSAMVGSTPTLVNPGDQVATVGVATSLQLQASDPSGAALSYSATGLPPGLLLTQNTGWIGGTPTTAGTYTVAVTVSNGTSSASQSFTWRVQSSTSTSPSTGVVLSGYGYRSKGSRYADLTWTGGSWTHVDVYRNGVKIAAGRVNSGAFTDRLGGGGTSSYAYTVCRAGSVAECSNSITVRI